MAFTILKGRNKIRMEDEEEDLEALRMAALQTIPSRRNSRSNSKKDHGTYFRPKNNPNLITIVPVQEEKSSENETVKENVLPVPGESARHKIIEEMVKEDESKVEKTVEVSKSDSLSETSEEKLDYEDDSDEDDDFVSLDDEDMSLEKLMDQMEKELNSSSIKISSNRKNKAKKTGGKKTVSPDASVGTETESKIVKKVGEICESEKTKIDLGLGEKQVRVSPSSPVSKLRNSPRCSKSVSPSGARYPSPDRYNISRKRSLSRSPRRFRRSPRRRKSRSPLRRITPPRSPPRRRYSPHRGSPIRRKQYSPIRGKSPLRGLSPSRRKLSPYRSSPGRRRLRSPVSHGNSPRRRRPSPRDGSPGRRKLSPYGSSWKRQSSPGRGNSPEFRKRRPSPSRGVSPSGNRKSPFRSGSPGKRKQYSPSQGSSPSRKRPVSREGSPSSPLAYKDRASTSHGSPRRKRRLTPHSTNSTFTKKQLSSSKSSDSPTRSYRRSVSPVDHAINSSAIDNNLRSQSRNSKRLRDESKQENIENNLRDITTEGKDKEQALDPVLEARRKKFESKSIIGSINKKIRLKPLSENEINNVQESGGEDKVLVGTKAKLLEKSLEVTKAPVKKQANSKKESAKKTMKRKSSDNDDMIIKKRKISVNIRPTALQMLEEKSKKLSERKLKLEKGADATASVNSRVAGENQSAIGRQVTSSTATDLRAELSRRRAQRLKGAALGSTRLVQSALEGVVKIAGKEKALMEASAQKKLKKNPISLLKGRRVQIVRNEVTRSTLDSDEDEDEDSEEPEVIDDDNSWSGEEEEKERSESPKGKSILHRNQV